MDVATTLTVAGITQSVKVIAGEKVTGWVTVAVAVAAGVALAYLDGFNLVRGALDGIVAVGGFAALDRVRK